MPGPYPATYNISDATATNIVDDAKFIELATAVNQERVRRGLAGQTFSFTNTVEAAELNALNASLNAAGLGSFSVGWTTGSLSPNTTITSSHINQLIDKIQAAGAVCICNCNYCTCDCNYCTCDCNYCTCNCNYCTCNCNYACTCNCNYSDETVKTNIVYM